MSGRTGRLRIGSRYFLTDEGAGIKVDAVSDFDALMESLQQVYPGIREVGRDEWRKAEREAAHD